MGNEMYLKNLLRVIFWRLLYFSVLPLSRFFLKNKIRIIYFHEINSTIADRVFRALKKKYTVISLEKLLYSLINNKLNTLPSNSIVITFDDGWKSNYSLLPVFQKYNLPITIFLCSDLINTMRGFWWKHNYTQFSNKELMHMGNDEKNKILANSNFEISSPVKKRETLNSEEINAMKNEVSFQAHTKTHPVLTMCSNEVAYNEISDSKMKLEKMFDLNIFAFAYPVGMYSDREINMVKKAGYSCAVSTNHGFIDSNVKLFELNRISGGTGNDYYETVVKISGIYFLFKNIFRKLIFFFRIQV